MTANFSTSVSNVVCIDLLNSSWQDIQNYCLISAAANGVKMYLKHLHTTLHNNLSKNSNPHLIYIENNYIIGTNRYGKYFKDLQLGGKEILPESNFSKIDLNIFSELENGVTKDKSLNLNPFLLNCFTNAFSDAIQTEEYDTVFINAHIEVKHKLAISLQEISKNYAIDVTFLDCNHEPDKAKLILNKIYYKGLTPIIFLFKNEENQQYMGWNKEFLVALQGISVASINKKDTLNVILDKINKVGLSNLVTDELSFLDYYSKYL